MTTREAYNAMTEEPYRGRNQETLQMAMANHGWTNPRFVTFKQALDNGCHVMKGSRGTQISKFGKDDNDEVFIKTYTVFNVAQLGGKIPLDWLEGDLTTYEAMAKEDLLTWPRADLVGMMNLAESRNDQNTVRLIMSHLDRRDRDEELAVKRIQRESTQSYIDIEIAKAEAACHFLVNAQGLSEGVTTRNLWQWTLKRARKYATEELLRYWVDNPRLTKKALLGDTTTREGNIKDSFGII